MNAPARTVPTAPPRMDAEEFVLWAEAQPTGRYELADGEVVIMAAERLAHVRAKTRTFGALDRAVRDAGLGCEAFGDGMAVRVGEAKVYEPDALVHCGPRLPGDTLLVTDPVIVVEVLSPSTRGIDTNTKRLGYFSVPTVAHYLVLDPEDRSVLHYRRGEGAGAPISARLLRAEDEEGGLRLDPPGLVLRLADLFDAP